MPLVNSDMFVIGPKKVSRPNITSFFNFHVFRREAVPEALTTVLDSMPESQAANHRTDSSSQLIWINHVK